MAKRLSPLVPNELRSLGNIFWMEAQLLRWRGQTELALQPALAAIDLHRQNTESPSSHLAVGRLGSIVTEISLDLAEAFPIIAASARPCRISGPGASPFEPGVCEGRGDQRRSRLTSSPPWHVRALTRLPIAMWTAKVRLSRSSDREGRTTISRCLLKRTPLSGESMPRSASKNRLSTVIAALWTSYQAPT